MDNGVDPGQKRRTYDKEALTFVKDVKVAFQDEREKYDEFLKIMADFKASDINTIGVISRAKELLKERKDLLLRFYNFVRKRYETDVGVDDRRRLNDALEFIKEVRVAFQDEREKYDEFLEIFQDFKARRTDTIGVMSRARELFKEHIHLMFGIINFLPNEYEFIINEFIVQLISSM